MNRIIKKIPIKDLSLFKEQLLAWSEQFEEVVWLDSNSCKNQPYREYEALLAVEAFTSLKTDYKDAFDQLEEYQSTIEDWIFGYLSYDLKNDTEGLSSNNKDNLGFADLYFFQPKKVFIIKNNCLEMHYLTMVDDELEDDYRDITSFKNSITDTSPNIPEIQSSITKEQYIDKVLSILEHIHRGDIYEANFCQEFYTHATLKPLQMYKRLNQISKPPFATYCRLESHYILSASPERYIKKNAGIIVSQPIKGTSRRGQNDAEDTALAIALQANTKERSENIMIVDLVRNDLSKTAQKGTVAVEELCGIYSFDQVHQMISTVTAQVGVGISPVDVIRTTYPMGSMTGAPKVKAMQLIEKYEATKRGVYSGSVGYITPEGDFDFNVIIRSILYNATTNYISYSVGGAITAGSNPESEYEECLLKAKAMRTVLERDM